MTKLNPDWEKEFDKRFKPKEGKEITTSSGIKIGRTSYKLARHPEVKNFIRSTIQAEKAKWVEETIKFFEARPTKPVKLEPFDKELKKFLKSELEGDKEE